MTANLASEQPETSDFHNIFLVFELHTSRISQYLLLIGVNTYKVYTTFRLYILFFVTLWHKET
jgi:hypothetical protein